MKLEAPLHALLIGIDHYPEGGSLADGSWYPDLGGSVRDIDRMQRFLVEDLDVPRSNIRRLSAPLPSSSRSARPDAKPTYGNMVAAFHELRRRAQPGEQVLIHYSGHGGRIPTLVPDLKPNDFDEAWVPTDIADSEARYLRDIELAWLLQELLAKNLWVTLVVDCCHSGGTTRLADVPRGGRAIDRTERPRDSRVASIDDLADLWKRKLDGTPRDLEVGSGWLPDPRGYVLLAACRAHELAHEIDVAGVGRVGAFSHWLLEALQTQDGDPGAYFQLLHRATAQVRSRLEIQTPQAEGDIERRVFHHLWIEHPRHAVNVLRIDGDLILLNTGQVHGVEAGDRFVVYSATDNDHELANAEVTITGAVDSWARIENRPRNEPILPGAQALPVQELASLPSIEHDDPSSPLAGKLRVGLAQLPADYDPALPARPTTGFVKRLEVECGDWLCLKVENLALEPFNITVLNRRPSGDVVQVFPFVSGGAHHVLEAQRNIVLPMRADLPTGTRHGLDLLEIFATLDATDFRWRTKSPTRSLEPSAHPSREWIAERVEVVVRSP